MKKRFGLSAVGGLLFLLCFSGSAYGSTITYEYQGSPLIIDPAYAEACALTDWCDPVLPAGTGHLSFDESILPWGSLTNATAEFYSAPYGWSASTSVELPAGDSFFAEAACPPGEWGWDSSCFYLPPGVIDFEMPYLVGAATRPTGETWTNLVFDANKDIVAWNIEISDGPPDYGSRGGEQFGDRQYVDIGQYGWSSSQAGTWTKVPEPATIALLILGLAGMAFARRRKAH